MNIIVESIGYTEEGFQMTVEATMPDGAKYHTKTLLTEAPVSLEYLKIAVDNAYFIVGRKAVEYLKLEDL